MLILISEFFKSSAKIFGFKVAERYALKPKPKIASSVAQKLHKTLCAL